MKFEFKSLDPGIERYEVRKEGKYLGEVYYSKMGRYPGWMAADLLGPLAGPVDTKERAAQELDEAVSRGWTV